MAQDSASTLTILRGRSTSDPVKVLLGERIILEQLLEPFPRQFDVLKNAVKAMGDALGMRVLEMQDGEAWPEQQPLSLGKTEDELAAEAMQIHLLEDR